MSRPPEQRRLASAPSLARRLLRRQIPPERREWELEDFEEWYRLRLQEDGRILAWAAYWREVLASIPAYWRERRQERRQQRHNLHPQKTSARQKGIRMQSLWQDTRYALRTLSKNPGFTLAAVLALALGIGANSAIFSVVDSVLLQALPYSDPDELVMVYERNFPRNQLYNVVNPGNFMDWREQNTVFQAMAAFTGRNMTLTGQGEPREVEVLIVTDGFFDVLQTPPQEGRLLTRQDGNPGSPTVVMISDSFWKRAFGGDPAVVGQSIELNSSRAEVVGILPPQMRFYQGDEDIYYPFTLQESHRTRSGRSLQVVARLKDGATLRQAQQEMAAIGERLEEAYPDFNSGWGVSVVSLHEDYVGDLQASVWMLFAAVGLVLLIACANVANLLLARSAGRRREVALRLALGAGRGRLLRQLLTESLLLGLLGAAAGLVLAWSGIRFLQGYMPADIPLPPLALDWRVLGFMLALALLTGLLFGLFPAWEGSRLSIRNSLQEGRSQSSGRSHGRLRNGLVVAEMALAVALLIGAGLLLQSLWALNRVDNGFRTDHLSALRLNLPSARYDAPARVDFFQRLLARIRVLPGVEAAAGNVFIPLSGPGSATSYWPDDRPAPQPGDRPVADVRPVTEGYFRTLGIEMLRGRDFDSRDIKDAPMVTVVNRTLAEAHWPGENPLGKTLTLSWGEPNPHLRVIGVVEDVRHNGPRQPVRSMVYLPVAQLDDFPFMTYLVRHDRDLSQSLPDALKSQVHALDPRQPVGSLTSMDQLLSDALKRPRLNASLLSLFSLLALILASLGIYGVMSYSVLQQRKELGIRMALGAHRRQIASMVVGRTLRLALAGLVIGLGAAWLLSRWMESLLFQTPPGDPLTFVAVSALLTLVALLAGYLPARRASRFDPIRVLRSE
ncbi:MAG TPA: ABC transporter permease [Acidobacteriota bacterium]|nr:ABC transporter permease [Acidobacteriota bacterium]